MLINEPNLTPEENLLANRMSDISEACYYATWLGSTEFHVWRLARQGGAWETLYQRWRATTSDPEKDA